MKNLHLLCNAHLDPVWLWEWQEGAAEVLSTFRVAADFCEEYEGFVFNHNEVILYKWVEEYEPELFIRIQELVKRGKWHIMGGWFLQPDLNMPTGESIVRQILTGRKYFKEKFNVEPTTAINFDSFGHSRGLVQILKKSGYDSYVFCRPEANIVNLPGEDFRWIGFDGSEVLGHRVYDNYLSGRGQATKKIKAWMESHEENKVGLLLWGIGNHGGGPSRVDLNNIKELMESTKDYNVFHSTPEKYFQELRENEEELPEHKDHLNYVGIGVYTSMAKIKQKHRLLENEIYSLEKMASSAVIQGYIEYPEKEINEVMYDLLLSQFHDILPGSSIKPVEEGCLRLIDHGLEIASRVKMRVFIALSKGQEKAKDGEIPILIYNPHPYKVEGIFECEFQLPDQNWEDTFSSIEIYQNGKGIPCQVEKEYSNLILDWRKHVVFSARLEPSQMNRFNCKVKILTEKPKVELEEIDNKIIFKTEELEVVINTKTGLIDKYEVMGVSYLKENAFLPIVIRGNDDTWDFGATAFSDVEGSFILMDKFNGTKYSGLKDKLLDSVRVIEDGEVRTIVEAVFCYGDSFICQRYNLPKKGTEIDINIKVMWNEKNKMLKISIPTMFETGEYLGQTVYGVQAYETNGREIVAQKWTAVKGKDKNGALRVINNCVYGSDCNSGEIRVSLIRSAPYASLPILERPLVAQDRFTDRIDQGERCFTLFLKGGNIEEVLEKVDRDALNLNEKPYALSFFPSGSGIKPESIVILSDDTVQMTALKKCEDSNDFIIRLFEPTGKSRTTKISIPVLEIEEEISFKGFEIKTFRINIRTKDLTETDLIEKNL